MDYEPDNEAILGCDIGSRRDIAVRRGSADDLGSLQGRECHLCRRRRLPTPVAVRDG